MTDLENEIAKESRESGYLLAYNDVMIRLSEMVTDKNRSLFVELSQRLSHDKDVRRLSAFLLNKEFFK